MDHIFSKDQCGDDEIQWITSSISFSFGLFNITIMVLIMLALRFKGQASSWYQGDTGVKQGVTLILPIYYPICFYAITIGLFTGVICVFSVSPFLSPPITCMKWIVVRFCCEGLSIFLLHNGIGQKAIRNALLGGASWALISGFVPMFFFHFAPESVNFYLYIGSFAVFLGMLIVFYLLYWLIPDRFLHRRPAMIRFSSLNAIINLIFFVDILLMFNRYSTESCLVVFLTDLTYFIQPFAILYALRQDTLFWQGLYVGNISTLNQPLLGVWEMGRETITCVADTINQLERRVVPIIAFGQLTVDTSKFFSGGNARVYRGSFKQHDVAIKFLFNIELTPANVVSFCDEATILNSLQHLNIVQCYGVAVMPPALCLVTEFCQYGSLYDFLHSLEFIVRHSRSSVDGVYRSHVVPNQPNVSIQKSDTHPSKNNIDLMQDNSVRDSVGKAPNNNRFSNSVGDRERRSTASRLADALGEPVINTLQTNLVIDVDTDENDDVEREFTQSSFLTGSTLEKLGFSTHMSEDAISLVSDREIRPGLAFASKIGKMLHSSKGHGNSSFNVGSIMKSAVSVLRSQDMGYGLGPSYTASGRHTRSRTYTKDSNGRSLSMTSTESAGPMLASARKSESTQKSIAILQQGSPVNVDRASDMDRQSGYSNRQQVGKSLPFLVKLCMARDAAAGVAFLHSIQMMHCDIKSLNFLVTKDLVVKLADLGEARPVDGTDTERVRQYPRNINWSSPEVLNGSDFIGRSADVWSLAFVIAEIFTGDVPFDTPDCRMLSFDAFKVQIQAGLRPTIPPELVAANPWFNEMISNAWAYDPRDRLTAIEIVGILDMNIQSILRRQSMGKYKET